MFAVAAAACTCHELRGLAALEPKLLQQTDLQAV